jgi:hypothetical protein
MLVVVTGWTMVFQSIGPIEVHIEKQTEQEVGWHL